MTASVFTQVGRRLAKVGVLASLALSAIFWYFGADAWHSILLGSAITAIAIAVWLVAEVEIHDTAWRDAGPAGPMGSRHDVTYLSLSLRAGWGRVGYAAESRLKQVGRQRLALRHLDLESPTDRPEIEQLIGRRAYRILVRSGRRRMQLRSLLHCLEALDGLDAAHSPVRRSRATRLTQSAQRRSGGQ